MKILVVDDEEGIRELLEILLRREGYLVETAPDGLSALAYLKQKSFDLVVSDIKMPKLRGIELLKRIKEFSPDTPVIMITAFSSTEEAVEAMRQGAYDYITKPFNNDEIRLVVRNALQSRALKRENESLKGELAAVKKSQKYVAGSVAMQKAVNLLDKVAPTDTSVLITGESGTGKELIARDIHEKSHRAKKSFRAINCAAIPETLLESELFGHERGAFTGAVQQRKGLFEDAHGGTVFLDEIGEIPPSMQVKLLRTLQEKEVQRIGGNQTISVDVRLIAATNKDLKTEIVNGLFREDLFYRINVFNISLPPLRERKEDIPVLIEHFRDKRGNEMKWNVSTGALEAMLAYDWPGNIRELENVIERCMVLGVDGGILVEHLPDYIAQSIKEDIIGTELEDTVIGSSFDLDNHLEVVERKYVLTALSRSGGQLKKAADLLGISFRSIRYRIKKYGLDVDDV